MEIINLLSNAISSEVGSAISIGDFRMINGPIPIHIYGENIAATIEIQGTLAIQEDVNISASTATFTTIENGTFYVKTLTALFAPVTHLRANISAYTSGTVNVCILI